MALPGNHTINTSELLAQTSSVGASPIATYMHMPFRGRILAISGVLGGAITTADATITITNVTTGVVVGTMTVTQSGSAAGQLFKGSPTTMQSSYVAQDDVISLVSSGASGSNVPMFYRVALRPN